MHTAPSLGEPIIFFLNKEKRCGFKALGERSMVPHRLWVSFTATHF